MPTDALGRALVTLTLMLVAVTSTGCGSGAGLDRTQLPLSMRAPYQRFEARCSRCHSLSRPLSAPVHSVEHWEHYLARMRRMPGAGINSADAELILQFLTYYTTVMQGHGTQGGDAAPDRGAALAGVGEGTAPVTTPASLTTEETDHAP